MECSVACVLATTTNHFQLVTAFIHTKMADAATALAKLIKDGKNYAVDDMPDTESTLLWDLVRERFNLTREETSSLVDAKRNSSQRDSSVVVTLKYSNRKKVEVSSLSPDAITVSFLKSQAKGIWTELQDKDFVLEGGRNHAIDDTFLGKCTFLCI